MNIGTKVVTLTERGFETDIEGVIRGTATIVNDNEQLVALYVVEVNRDQMYFNEVKQVDPGFTGLILVHQAWLKERR